MQRRGARGAVPGASACDLHTGSGVVCRERGRVLTRLPPHHSLVRSSLRALNGRGDVGDQIALAQVGFRSRPTRGVATMLFASVRRESGGGDGENGEHERFPKRNISGGDATLQSVPGGSQVGHSPSAPSQQRQTTTRGTCEM
eukprot:2256409-Prymnesium_polylepis.2